MRKTYKYRIYPTTSQISKLENTFSMCRHLYNWSLAERKETYEETGKSVSYYDQQNALPDLKKDRPWFKGVHSQVLQDVLKRLDNAYQAFFRRVKSGDDPGFPKFKKRGQWNSITYPQYKSFPVDNQFKVSKIGTVKINLHRELPVNSNIKTLTIVKEGSKWFACFSLEYILKIEPKLGMWPSIGIDLGTTHLYTASHGTRNKSKPKHLIKAEKRLAKMQRRFAKTKKRSPERAKVVKALQKVHFKVRNTRNYFLHKEANKLLELGDQFFFENLDIKRMSARPEPIPDESGGFEPNGAKNKSRCYNKPILDAAWGKFLQIVTYKAEKTGKQVHKVDPFNTSQLCCRCGALVKKSIDQKQHICPHCRLKMHRDKNAARNILRRGLSSLGQLPLEAPAKASA